MAVGHPDEVIAGAIRAFLDCLPRPFFYAADATPQRLHRVIAPRAGVIVVALNCREAATVQVIATIATRTRADVIALSRDTATSERLRFDLRLRRDTPSAISANYTFCKTANGALFAPVGSGRLVYLDAGGLTAGDELYFTTSSGELAAVDRAASRLQTQFIDSL